MKLELELTEVESQVLLSLLADNSFKSKQVDAIWRKYSRAFSAHKWSEKVVA